MRDMGLKEQYLGYGRLKDVRLSKAGLTWRKSRKKE